MLHFLNCLALGFGPHIYFYRTYLKIQRNGFQVCAATFFTYIVVAIVKLFLVASLFPFHHSSSTSHSSYSSSASSSSSSSSLSASTAWPSFSVFDESLSSFLRFIDVFIFIFLYQYILPLHSLRLRLRLAAVIIGWSWGHSVLHYGVVLWWKAREYETYLNCLKLSWESNLELVSYASFIVATYFISKILSYHWHSLLQSYSQRKFTLSALNLSANEWKVMIISLGSILFYILFPSIRQFLLGQLHYSDDKVYALWTIVSLPLLMSAYYLVTIYEQRSKEPVSTKTNTDRPSKNSKQS